MTSTPPTRARARRLTAEVAAGRAPRDPTADDHRASDVPASVPVPAPGAHGGDGPAVAAALGIDPDDVVDLSQTLNPFGPDVAALCRSQLDRALGHYPDPRQATAALAVALGADEDQVLVTNGGSQAIALVAAVLGGSVRREPEFSLHPRGKPNGGGNPGPVWRSNPHNPTGVLAGAAERAGVWDEAFYPLATGRWTRGDTADGAMIVGSLTKVFACPGLRIGYVLGRPEVVAQCRDLQPAWSVNSLALAVLPALLAEAGTGLEEWARRLAAARTATTAVLASHDLMVALGDAPWVLCRAPGLRDALARHGVVVRDCGSFGYPGVVRIAAADDRSLERLDLALTRGWNR
jgi:histidinol-phosphate/aromatic aminotransferase/cobyric acid decarboxylase-like protein